MPGVTTQKCSCRCRSCRGVLHAEAGLLAVLGADGLLAALSIVTATQGQPLIAAAAGTACVAVSQRLAWRVLR